MARKNMDILVGNILGDATIQPQEKNDKTNVTSKEKQNTPQSPKNNKASPKEDQWQHFSFICSTELVVRSEEHTSELQSPYVSSYAVFFLKKKKNSGCISRTGTSSDNQLTA